MLVYLALVGSTRLQALTLVANAYKRARGMDECMAAGLST